MALVMYSLISSMFDTLRRKPRCVIFDAQELSFYLLKGCCHTMHDKESLQAREGLLAADIATELTCTHDQRPALTCE